MLKEFKRKLQVCRHRRFQVAVTAGTTAGIIMDHFLPTMGSTLVLVVTLMWIWEQ